MEVIKSPKILNIYLTIFTGWILPHPVAMPAPSVCCRTNLHWFLLNPAAMWVTLNHSKSESVCVGGVCVCYQICFFKCCLGAKWGSDRNTCAQQIQLRGWLTEWTLYWKWKCHGYLLHLIISEQNCQNYILSHWYLARLINIASEQLLVNKFKRVTESNNLCLKPSVTRIGSVSSKKWLLKLSGYLFIFYSSRRLYDIINNWKPKIK